MSKNPISFLDHVRVRATPLTEASGFAGLIGQVYGYTIPSKTGPVDVIGEVSRDFAFNVYFLEFREGFWFAPELLEFVDHAPGSEIQLKGNLGKWVRGPNGEWEHKE